MRWRRPCLARSDLTLLGVAFSEGPCSHTLASIPLTVCRERSEAGVSPPFLWTLGSPGHRCAHLRLSARHCVACRRQSRLLGLVILSRLTCLPSTPAYPVCTPPPPALAPAVPCAWRAVPCLGWHLLPLPPISPARASSLCITVPRAQSLSLAGFRGPVPPGRSGTVTEPRHLPLRLGIVVCPPSSSRGAPQAVAGPPRLGVPAAPPRARREA